MTLISEAPIFIRHGSSCLPPRERTGVPGSRFSRRVGHLEADARCLLRVQGDSTEVAHYTLSCAVPSQAHQGSLPLSRPWAAPPFQVRRQPAKVLGIFPGMPVTTRQVLKRPHPRVRPLFTPNSVEAASPPFTSIQLFPSKP